MHQYFIRSIVQFDCFIAFDFICFVLFCFCLDIIYIFGLVLNIQTIEIKSELCIFFLIGKKRKLCVFRLTPNRKTKNLKKNSLMIENVAPISSIYFIQYPWILYAQCTYKNGIKMQCCTRCKAHESSKTKNRRIRISTK